MSVVLIMVTVAMFVSTKSLATTASAHKTVPFSQTTEPALQTSSALEQAIPSPVRVCRDSSQLANWQQLDVQVWWVYVCALYGVKHAMINFGTAISHVALVPDMYVCT